MDRIGDCGSSDDGSIPSECTGISIFYGVGCKRGLIARSRKPWGAKVPRGFESRPHRHELVEKIVNCYWGDIFLCSFLFQYFDSVMDSPLDGDVWYV